MDTQLLLRVSERGADAERLGELADGLRTELLALDVEDVIPIRGGEPPPGSRAIDVAMAGALLATLSGSSETIGHLVAAVRSWLGRNRDSDQRTVELTVGDMTLRVTRASDEQQDRLIKEFIGVVGRQ